MLYHPPDPVGALICSAMNLKSGGQIYIESAVYEGKDDYACRSGETTVYSKRKETKVHTIIIFMVNNQVLNGVNN